MEKKTNIPAISPEHLSQLNEIKKKVDSGEIKDAKISEALNAIDLAGKIMNSIMSGSQIDPTFLKNMIRKMEESMSDKKDSSIKKVKKVKKFKRAT